MALRKKSFECGHGGKGRFCHRCAQEERAAAARLAAAADEQRRMEERTAGWDMRFDEQRGECHKFPEAVVERAFKIADSLRGGTHYSRLRGHKLTPDPSRVRFDLPMSYRMVADLAGDGMAGTLKVMSHAEYNRFFPR